MASRPRFNKKEVDIRVRPNRRGDQRRPLVPWWMRLEKRHLIAKRAQIRGKRGRKAFGRKAELINGAAWSR